MTIEERINKHVCCFCEGELERNGWQDPKMWGNNPDNACSRENARCCNRCDELIVWPVRVFTSNTIRKVVGNEK